MTDVRIFEVGPRDGLQNEKGRIPTRDKIALIDLLSAAGFPAIEATSFVSPKWVPQLADADEVMNGIHREPGVSYAVLTPNMKGFERAVAAGASEVAVFASASEAFSLKNINCTIAESIARFAPLIEAASAADLPVRGYVSCAVECPYSGPVDPGAAREVAVALHEMGCYEISLADTIGRATPEATRAMLQSVIASVPPDRLAGHFHDTGGTALRNVAVALELGLRSFDSAVGGLGGCPYAPGAKGNLSTGALLDVLDGMGVATGIDRDRLALAEEHVAGLAAATREEAER
ncbi:hydroxymethylglutaryl-CoA lyase [Roseicyclus sp. F158]|uniref:Hydroxymethylglutaryl-CoA lyase n=1 Tax=Tropicimonas omnivorans TaxID=3075590 RepID=A0ABU3DL77_9RHOB|nr:hydroxymethylglutaryl-CoA lyase [Roseicyclus sp. F158]MDT0684299.1 hydroxymethylglutaryl-CoA lyase [Roseicyclus sp. F158]